ncbi:MAG: hypothetical protein WDZ77_01935 [Candidatus Pacearchaeota archaeon]
MGLFGDLGVDILNSYTAISSSLPPLAEQFTNFILIVILVGLYAIFIWKFYNTISKKNLFESNLSQYNTSQDQTLTKGLAFLIYILEYLIIFPILIFIWFSVFTIFLILLTEDLAIGTLLLISATVITAIRLTSYYRKKLSEDIAKLIPFTLLAVSLLTPGFFSIERLISQFQRVSFTFNELFVFFIFIISLELILRMMDLIFTSLDLKDETDNEKNEES